MTNIKQAKELIEGYRMEYESNHPMFLDEDIETLDWLIDQAKKAEYLKAENDRLKQRNAQVTYNYNKRVEKYKHLERENERLKKEIGEHEAFINSTTPGLDLVKQSQRYKKALEEITDSYKGSFQATTGEGHAQCIKIAQQALKEDE